MSDNTTLNPGVGGDTIREIEKGGAKTQVILLDIGGLGVESLFSGAVSVSNFPASQAVTGTFFQATQPVSGSVSVSNFPATQPVSGTVTATGPLTDTQLRAVAVPVSGTFFQATQPVSAASLPLPSNASIETGGNLATIAAKDFATETTLAATSVVIGAEADAAVRSDDDGTVSARLRGISEQLDELIDVQKENQSMFLQMLFALQSISQNNPYEVQ